MTNYDKLLEEAAEARKRAYAPYSRYAVGAALLASSNVVYSGCNVENRSYGLTVCAERVALFKAIAAGERRFKALAVVTEGPDLAMPCGACRQTLAEFGLDLVIVAATAQGLRTTRPLRELLPLPFIPSEVTSPRLHHPSVMGSEATVEEA